MRKKIIWVVDDDVIFQVIIRKIIERSEMFSVISIFPNGKEAFLALKDASKHNEMMPNIILLDINMPIMDGWEFMEEISSMEDQNIKQINICISTSSIAEEDKNRAKNYPSILNYLSKPISVNDLLNVLDLIKEKSF
jgi:CheY-like chemotaxis protein